MIQQNANINLADADLTTVDPTEWLKGFVNSATNLYYPPDCNNLKNAKSGAYSTYKLDALNVTDAMAAWSVFNDETQFHAFLTDTQMAYSTIPLNWYNYTKNVSYSTFKHTADLMTYFGSQTAMDEISNPVVNGTNYGLDIFWQNYNEDWWYNQKYTGVKHMYCTSSFWMHRTIVVK